MSNGDLRSMILEMLSSGRALKPRVFVSYHHGGDQLYALRFERIFDNRYDIITDRSLDEELDSDDDDYIYQRIRDEFISGTSCTIVLCGLNTMNRKHVDWEIKATLDKKHALLGVLLPTHLASPNGKFTVPDRLHDNIVSGYAHWTKWTEDPGTMFAAIEAARVKASQTKFITNSRQMMGRNR